VSRHGAVVAAAPRVSRRAWVAFAELRAAVGFLTRVPVRVPAADLDRTGAAAFGLVGAATGLVASVPLLILGPRLALPAAVLALLVVVIASGGLHLDGLADTADALASPTADAAERARADPRAGPAGVAAVVLDLLLAAALLAALAAREPRMAAVALVLATGGSRAAPPVAAWIERNGRRATRVGLGGWFSARVTTVDVQVSVVTTALLAAGGAALLGGAGVAIGTVVGTGFATGAAALLVARRGQLDGDGYGAIVEVTFLSILAGIAVQIA
jgi:adenosylcobinamide-GDP ribazoletransferase